MDKLSKTYRSEKNISQPPSRQKQKVKAGVGRMVRGLTKTTAQAISQGRVDPDIREQRYQTCKDCEHFIPDSKRCAECGCFMEMKTWIGGDPSTLCPLNKWLK